MMVLAARRWSGGVIGDKLGPMNRLAGRCFLPILVTLIAVSTESPAYAQTQGGAYSPWTDPALQARQDVRQQNDRVGKLIKELRALTNKASRARAADPNFLNDLRDLADRYENPWSVVLLRDDFADGDFTRNPTWTVSAGKFWVEPGYGLRSTPELVAQPRKKMTREEKAADLLSTILTGKRLDQPAPRAEPGHAAINAAAPMTNAFSLTFEFTSWEKKGQFEVGAYITGAGNNGYRLIYQPGATPVLRLMRVSATATGIVTSYRGALNLEDRKTHVVQWTRDKGGEMVVSVDGKELMRATDRGFQAGFDGIVLINGGGDYVVKNITVMGAPKPAP